MSTMNINPYKLNVEMVRDRVTKYKNSTLAKIQEASSFLTKYQNSKPKYTANTAAYGAIRRVLSKMKVVDSNIETLCKKALVHIENMENYENGKPINMDVVNDGRFSNLPSWVDYSKPDFGTKEGLEVLGHCSKINVTKQMNLTNLIVGYGYDPSDIYKILYDANGNHLNAKQIASLKQGDTIYILKKGETGIFEPVTNQNIVANEIVINGLDKIDKSTIETTRIGMIYGDYDGLASPVKNNKEKFGINEKMGTYQGDNLENRIHWGYDLVTVDGLNKKNYNSAGQNISSIGDGVVLESGYDTYGGNKVTIATLVDDEVVVTSYMHMQNASDLKPGDVVKQGDNLGTIGSTGSAANGNHLHIETEVISLNKEQKVVIEDIKSREGNLDNSEVQKLIDSGIKSTPGRERKNQTFNTKSGQKANIVDNGKLNEEYAKKNGAPLETIFNNNGISEVEGE